MRFNAIDAKSVCCRMSTAIGDQKDKSCTRAASAGRAFFIAAGGNISVVSPVFLGLSFLVVFDPLPDARSWMLGPGLCLFTWSALFTSAFVVEPDGARFRFPRLDPKRGDEGFLRRAELICDPRCFGWMPMCAPTNWHRTNSAREPGVPERATHAWILEALIQQL